MIRLKPQTLVTVPSPLQLRRDKQLLTYTVPVKVTFKPLRANAAFPPTALDLEPSTPISSIKSELGNKSNMFPDKLRLMLKHKVLGDAVTIAETVGEGESEVTINVMIMPGAQKPAEEETPKVEEKADVVVPEKRKASESEDFWGELSEWLKRKVGEDEGGKRLAVFKNAWEQQKS
jgi:hypothetical protein